MTRDANGVPLPTPPTLLSRLYAGLGYAPLCFLLAVLAAQVVFTLDVRELWHSDEVRHANALQHMIEAKQWFVLTMNGEAYPDKPPLYFLFLALIREIAALSTSPELFFTGVAISGLLALLATHALARLVARVDGKTALAAGIILLSCFFFSGLLHYSRMDLLFTACITAAHVFLFHALVRERAPLLMTLGNLLAGAAVLIKGPFGLAFPWLAALGFLLWQGRIRRIFRLDIFLGALTGLALPAIWLALAYITTGEDFIQNILHQQVLGRALKTWHHAQPWHFYFLVLPALCLPWTFLVFCLPWGRACGRANRQAISASRTPDKAGLGYLWSVLATNFALLSLVSIKLPIYLLPLFPPLAVLAARAIMGLSPQRSRRLYALVAFCLACMGAGFIALPMLPALGIDIPLLPLVPNGTFILAAVCLVSSCALLFLPDNKRPEAGLLLMALFSVLFAYPAWSITAPSLDAFMSPKAQAETIKALKEKGYQVASVGVLAGTHAYYAGPIQRIKTWEEALAFADKTPKAALVLRAAAWDDISAAARGFSPVQRQVIAEREYVVIARPDPNAPAAPAKGSFEKEWNGERAGRPQDEAQRMAHEQTPAPDNAPAPRHEQPAPQQPPLRDAPATPQVSP